MKKDEESNLFSELVGDVEPRKRAPARINLAAPRTVTPGLSERRRAAQQVLSEGCNPLASAEFVQLVKPRDILSFKRDGVQHGVFKNLRLGKYPVDSRLDLHGFSVDQSRQQLHQFVYECVEHNIRCALITHGRGEQREKPALLKSCVNQWLPELEPVLAFHGAQPQHGGSGSTYILLRKSAAKRSENLEPHQKGKRQQDAPSR